MTPTTDYATRADGLEDSDFLAEDIADDLIARCVRVGDLTAEELATMPDYIADESPNTVLFLDEYGLIVWEEEADEDEDY